MILGLATAVCLAAFLATLFLPRIDGQLVGSDGIGYYVYLPSLLIDHDLDFTNQYACLYAYDPAVRDAVVGAVSGTGLPVNQWSIGPAVLWLPFFLLAHLVVLALGGAADGMGIAYQALVLGGSILYGGAGLWLAWRATAMAADEDSALFGVLLASFGGNLVYYMTAEPFMSHAGSAFAVSLVVWWMIRTGNAKGVANAAVLGAMGGLAALIRPQDGLILVLPFVLRLIEASGAGAGDRIPGVLRDGLVAAGVSFLVFLPQMAVWGHIYGSWFRSPYFYVDAPVFDWTAPHLRDVLFSSWRGLFTWHPVFLAAVAGLLLPGPGNRGLRWGGLAFVGLQVYIVASWVCWWQGDAFGGRMFIACLPFFSLGLARLYAAARERGLARACLVSGAVLVGLNFLLYVHYRFLLVHLDRPVTWTELALGRFGFMLGKLLR